VTCAYFVFLDRLEWGVFVHIMNNFDYFVVHNADVNCFSPSYENRRIKVMLQYLALFVVVFLFSKCNVTSCTLFALPASDIYTVSLLGLYIEIT